MDFVAKYNEISSGNYGESFVGANTGKGFLGCYREIINESALRRLYVIKGAAGTGKSTFMRRICNEAEKAGLKVQRFICSSDHDSLDAVIVNDMAAVIDGTSPHSYELKYPGAVSEILDYTKYWDNAKLVKHREGIIRFTDKKSEAYLEAYSHLKCEMNLRVENYKSIMKVVNKEKMESQIRRFIELLSLKNNRGPEKRVFTRSVGMKGRYRLGSDSDNYKTVIKVSDVYGSAYVYMKELSNQLNDNNVAHTVSLDPVCPEMICDIMIPSINMIISIDDLGRCDKAVNMVRFIDNYRLGDLRGFLRLSAKCIKLFSAETDYYLSLAGKAHFELEKIYGETMNFDFLNTYSEMKIKEIIDTVKL